MSQENLILPGKLPEITGNKFEDRLEKTLVLTEVDAFEDALNGVISQAVRAGIVGIHKSIKLREYLSEQLYSAQLVNCFWQMTNDPLGHYKFGLKVYLAFMMYQLMVESQSYSRWDLLNIKDEYRQSIRSEIMRVKGKIQGYRLLRYRDIRRRWGLDYEELDYNELNQEVDSLFAPLLPLIAFKSDPFEIRELYRSCRCHFQRMLKPERRDPTIFPELVGLGLSRLVPNLVRLKVLTLDDVIYIVVACFDDNVRGEKNMSEVWDFFKLSLKIGVLSAQDYVDLKKVIKNKYVDSLTSLDRELELRDLFEIMDEVVMSD